MFFAVDDGHGITNVGNSITSSGYDIQSDHSVAGWLKGQFVRTLKLGGFPVDSTFVDPKGFLILCVVSESRVVEEVDAQNEVVTKFVEYMHIVHKFLLVDFKWDWVDTQAFNLISGCDSHCTDHVEFLWSFSNWKQLPEFGGCHAA
jgi:hypothetical protein